MLILSIAESLYLPTGYCYLWDGPLISLHMVSNLIVGFAFLAIPSALLWLVHKRGDVSLRGVVLWFTAFMAACAASCFLTVWNFWHQDYWLAGAVEALAAVTSAAAAGSLILLLPKAVRLPSARQMELANERLAEEVAARERIMKQLQTLNQELETRVRSRTEQLEAALHDMQTEIGERRAMEAALRRWETIFAHAGWGIALANPENYRLEAVNPAFAAMHGWTVEELTGVSLAETLAPECRQQLEDVARASDELGHSVYEAEHVRKDGTRFPVLADVVACKDSTGRVLYRAANFQDITERKRADQERLHANQRLTALLRDTEERSRQSALIKQMSTLLQTCANTREAYDIIHEFAARLFPADSGALCLLNPSVALMEAVAAWGSAPQRETMFAPEDCWALRTGRVHVSSPDGVTLNCVHTGAASASGYVCVPMMAHNEAIGVLSVRCADSVASLPRDSRLHALEERQELALNFAGDIALALANLRLRETLRTQSTRDALTGLFNRRYLTESLDREVRRADRNARPLGIVMLDLDQFKPFNDTHGHEAGDALLRSFGRFIQKNTRGEDIACRYGGDEFVILLVDADLDVARRRAEELREGFSRMVVRHLNQKLDSVSFSMGVAAFPLHGTTSDDLLAAADEALYDAKAQGRNRVSIYKGRE
ncbi:MAG TPA: diguanylate cyclase [Candidatus Acidoferrales bacterium]|nr:diguanylate cyclase [Candidatus Acidoferrales bacterium]